MDIKEIEGRLARYFSSRPEIKAGYIFGSRTRGVENGLSDIDVAILVDDAISPETYPYGYKAKILTDLLKLLKTDNIDLVVLNNAPCLLRHRAICRGRLVYSGAERERIKFQVRTIAEYCDFKRLMTAAPRRANREGGLYGG
ncbi:MAG: nucleotidyltransferase domain-containing protein [Elusimicrobia bacterium]|nr:nucleotidyltransferase domain-containing protein [Elusimicrobiota bacterium]